MRTFSIWSVGVVLAVAGSAFGQEEAGKTKKAAGAGAANAQVLKDIDVKKDLEYAKPDGKPQMLDIYMPKSGTGPFPLIVWIHGGGWAKGTRAGPTGLPLVKEGYVLASVEYRLMPTAYFPAQIYDCKAAIRWLRANAATYKIDPNHIGVWGGSAGGHLVALLGTSGGVKDLEGDEGNLDQSSTVQAVCDYFGPANFFDSVTHTGAIDERMAKAAADPNNTLVKLLGGPGPDIMDRAKKASPDMYIDKSDPPFLIVHGDKDPLVPLAQSKELNELLKKAGVESDLIVLPGAGHSTPDFRTPEVIAKVGAFFDKHLKAAPTGGK